MSAQENLEFVIGRSRARMFAPVSTHDIQILRECSVYCRISSKTCLQNGYKREALICIQCAEICELAAKFKSCQSEFLSKVFQLCAHVCQRCEIEINKLPLEECKKCVEACKKCLRFVLLQANKNKT